MQNDVSDAANMAVCPQKAVELSGSEISNWSRGEDTLPFRMADYLIGLMNGKWENVIHILHMYNVTELCDCVDIRQSPMIENDTGFLISKNPFAVDWFAARILRDWNLDRHKATMKHALAAAENTAKYVKNNYGIIVDAPVKKMSMP